MIKMKTEVKITNFNVNWQAIKDACMQTIGKEAGDKEPPQAWKRKLLICRHSPIRRSLISWKWNNIPFYVMGHFVRHHVGCTPYVSTSREDRTNTPRNERKQTDNISMQMDANIQSLIDMAEKRLCTQSDAITKEYMEDLKDVIAEYDEDIAWALAPSGIYKCGCPEKFGKCNYCTNILKQMPIEELFDIEKRLDYYNDFREKLRKKKI